MQVDGLVASSHSLGGRPAKLTLREAEQDASMAAPKNSPDLRDLGVARTHQHAPCSCK